MAYLGSIGGFGWILPSILGVSALVLEVLGLCPLGKLPRGVNRGGGVRPRLGVREE